MCDYHYPSTIRIVVLDKKWRQRSAHRFIAVSKVVFESRISPNFPEQKYYEDSIFMYAAEWP